MRHSGLGLSAAVAAAGGVMGWAALRRGGGEATKTAAGENLMPQRVRSTRHPPTTTHPHKPAASQNWHGDYLTLPEVTMDALNRMDGQSGRRAFVALRATCGVYDVSRFLDLHPGGRKRLLGFAGGEIDEQFMYWGHHSFDEAHAVLRETLVGRLADCELCSSGGDSTSPAISESELPSDRGSSSPAGNTPSRRQRGVTAHLSHEDAISRLPVLAHASGVFDDEPCRAAKFSDCQPAPTPVREEPSSPPQVPETSQRHTIHVRLPLDCETHRRHVLPWPAKGGGLCSDAVENSTGMHSAGHAEGAPTLPGELVSPDLTSVSNLFVRNHAPVPQFELLRDSGNGVGVDGSRGHFGHSLSFCWAGDVDSEPGEDSDDWEHRTLGELCQQLSCSRIRSVLQCAGNRAGEALQPKSQPGEESRMARLGMGAVGNAEWGGYRLTDVLRGMFPGRIPTQNRRSSQPAMTGLHVHFVGEDGFRSSTPLDDLLSAEEQGLGALLALTHNGMDLLPDHGFPARVILPGFVGARQVKWLSSISIERTPCNDVWTAGAGQLYKKDCGTAIQHMPRIQALVVDVHPATTPSSNAHAGGEDGGLEDIVVTGVVFTGHDRGDATSPQIVEVSVDRGLSWVSAELLFPEKERGFGRDESNPDDHENGELEPGTEKSWVRWRAPVTIASAMLANDREDSTGLQMWARATDSAGFAQEEHGQATKSGYLHDGWDKVPLALLAEQGALSGSNHDDPCAL
jgi:DMSO/TMAO reductase YedYZ molybdopterin-dependent catalytic subunit